ncbi:MAG TPA: lysylphosphatidylglycerol synthase transmembrane domain-containing protein [Bacteroidia bacterium]|nr:lysylphosphatidylglycerol synthase transmembrane domain-containing protein [Bacteroidia bacterium]
MSPKIKSALQLILFATIGIGLVWLSIHNIPDKDIETTKQSFKIADYTVVVFSALISILAHVIRAWRWDMLMKPLGHKISFKNSFAAVMIGYAVNYAVPRAGELSRCGVAAKYEKIPFAAALGTVITERIIDLIMLLVLFFITLAVQFNQLIGLTNTYVTDPLSKKFGGLLHNTTYLVVIIAGILAFAAGLFILRNKIKSLFTGKIGGLLKSFGDGLKSVKDLEKPGLFILQSFLIWLMYFLSLYVCLFCFPETKTIGVSAALAFMLFTTIGVMVSPGGIGAYQLIGTQILLFYKVASGVSVAFPWIVWGVQFVAIIVIGGLCFIFLPLLNRNNNGNNLPADTTA